MVLPLFRALLNQTAVLREAQAAGAASGAASSFWVPPSREKRNGISGAPDDRKEVTMTARRAPC